MKGEDYGPSINQQNSDFQIDVSFILLTAKISVIESIFNKVGLVILTKITWRM